ncbi:uncharacterized protein LOC128553174 [Mercenaria mercenaria]|uniref:uncharacterized protein LOC128553174 n=1 Tax=Mercenaria mercenaria TaxID=6596 RepID=UPI00234E69E2|nr:uncharacterized protein LOC128553174 [Mercenaria mercenaria]
MEMKYIERNFTVRGVSAQSYATVVTGFFDIGPFKRTNHEFRRRTFYYNGAGIFKRLRNMLVVYSDSRPFLNHIKNIRSDRLNETKLIFFERSSAWPFHLAKTIRRIYSSVSYPKHYPTTLSSLYTCTMHAKYYCLNHSATNNFFKTKHIMWLDVGYFWRRLKTQRNFYLKTPNNFNDSKIAMTRIYTGRSIPRSPIDIIKHNHFLVGGGLVYGDINVMLQFSSQYKRAVEYFLANNASNSDQQIILAIFTQEGRNAIKPEVEIQMYGTASNRDWHFLGDSMIEE